MIDIIIGEKVINKIKQVGTIISFDEKFITIDFKTKVVKLLPDSFEQGFLKYENPELQAMVDKANSDKEQKKRAIHADEEKARSDREKIQAETSKKYLLVSIMSANIRLDPAPLSLKAVRKKDADLIQKIFTECDKDAQELYNTVTPDLKYTKRKSNAKSKYAVGFLTKYCDTYVFRVFSRNDTYKKDSTRAVFVSPSDTTEVLRILRVNGKLYYFSKHLACAGEFLANSTSHSSWHVSNFNNSLLLNEVIKKCDCEYLNDYIEEKNVSCMPYVKLLFATLDNNKAEIVFKQKLFAATYYIDDIIAYLSEFNTKQIDFASKNNLINALPIIKSHGNLDLRIYQSFEAIMRKRKYGISLYSVLESKLALLNLECSDLIQKLVNFLKKIDIFNATLYYDYINMLAEEPDVSLRDFFDKHYIDRHNILLEERMTTQTRREIAAYNQVANELSWIDREENGYFIILPKNISDFSYEGQMQHNCVYTNRYYELVIARQSIIVFLRKEPNTPYVTIEYDYETFEVMQAYTKFNNRIDPELYQYIVDLGKRLLVEMLSQQ